LEEPKDALVIDVSHTVDEIVSEIVSGLQITG